MPDYRRSSNLNTPNVIMCCRVGLRHATADGYTWAWCSGNVYL